VAGAVGTEWLLGGQPRGKTLRDNTALLTGLLLGLTLPPGLPLWMAFVGGVVGIGLGKLVWGGMGHNMFNPALVGRAFLQAAFPVHLTTWVPPTAPGDFFLLRSSNFPLPFMQSTVDGVSAATPLAMAKFEQEQAPLASMFLGDTSGSLGETSTVILIVCGLWMVYRKIFDWRIPSSILVTVFLLSGLLYAIAPAQYPPPWYMLASGGLLFGAIYMATDPVGSPLAPNGAWIFGVGIGTLVVLIRLFGGLPEGVQYSILLMNSAAPLIDRGLQPRRFGRARAP
jgi:electron transport complex protein RnfD